MYKLIQLFVVAFFLVSCGKSKKEKTPDPVDSVGTNTPKGTLIMHIHNYVDMEEIDGYNIVYTTTDGRKVSFSIAQLYLSEFQLVKMDGSYYDLGDTIVLKTQNDLVYEIGDVPIGNYKSVRFKVGLTPAKNISTPTTNASDVLNTPAMWFGSAAQPDGFVFLNFQGKIDTTTAANGATIDMQPFDFRVGTNSQYKQVALPESNFTITENQVSYVHMKVDCTRLWSGITLNDETNLIMNSPTDNATSLGIQLGNNIPSMFSLEY